MKIPTSVIGELNLNQAKLLNKMLEGLFNPAGRWQADVQEIILTLVKRVVKLEGMIEEIPKQMQPAIERSEKIKEDLLKNCVIMQSRVVAILRVPEAIEGLCQGDVFGSEYEDLLKEDERELREAILAAGGQLDESNLRERSEEENV